MDRMIRYGTAPFLECSTKGDRRFSAFGAYIGAHTIENLYQGAKIFSDGSTGLSWRQAKGLRAVNQEAVARLYSKLWDMYIDQHPELKEVLKNATGVSDVFGQEGHVCQATELWRIKQTL
jgi:hypothetical protein